MIKDIPIKFASKSSEVHSSNSSIQRLINLYAEPNPDDSKYDFTLYGTAGLKSFTTVGDGPIYGIHKVGSLLYVVSGNSAYKVDGAGTATELGSIGATNGNVVMSPNGEKMVIVKQNGDAYVASSSTVTQITDADFPSVNSVDFMDGYSIFGESGTGNILISSLTDPFSYDATDFTEAQGNPDNVVRVFVDHEELWVFGEESVEIYYNSGNVDFPFERINGAFIERGCAAKLSVVKEDNTIIWLGDDKIVYRADGYKPTRISTYGIEERIRKFSQIDDASAFSFTEAGHKFYVITFLEEKVTLVCDLSTGLWHDRETFAKGRWEANVFEGVFGKNLVGSFDSNALYELDRETYTDGGTTIKRTAITPYIYEGNKRLVHDKIFLDIEPGVGVTSGQGSDPQVMMRYTEDGKTWSNEKWRDIGKKGKYKNQANWRRQGTSRKRAYEFSVTDPVKVAINGAYASVTVLES